MKTLDRYIFKEIFFPSVIALVALTFVAFIREIGALLEVMARQTAAHLRDLKYEIAVKQVSLELRARVFNERLTNWILYVQDVAPEGLNWRGIMLADLHDPNDPRVTFARSGSLVANNDNHS